MDIAKIRKKAQAKEKKDKAEKMPVTVELTEKGREEQPQDMPRESLGSTEEVRDEFSPEASGEKADEQVDKTQPKEETRSEEKQEDILELLTFSLSEEEFAFRVSEVEEIIRYQKITRVPAVPDYVLGITSLRGKVMPVIGLKIRLGLEKNPMSDDHTDAEMVTKSGADSNKKIVIVSGSKGLIGAAVDKVIGVVRFPDTKMLEPPAHLTDAELRFIEGVVIFEKRFISIIRLENTMDIEVS